MHSLEISSCLASAFHIPMFHSPRQSTSTLTAHLSFVYIAMFLNNMLILLFLDLLILEIIYFIHVLKTFLMYIYF